MGSNASREQSRASLGDVVFEDDQVAVCENGIELKWYYLPAGHSKFVRYDDLAGVEKAARYKDWGLSPIDGVWWASGFGNLLGIKLYFKDTAKQNKMFGCGFSVKNELNINKVLELILIRIQYRGLEVPELKKLISTRGINAANCTLKDDFIQLLEKYDRENVAS